MLFSILLILGMITLAFGIVPLRLSNRFKKYVKVKLKEPLAEYTPNVSIIMPCKGLDLEFEKNIEAIFNQNYPNYEILFVTATEDDPAYIELKRIITKHKSIPAKLLVAGITPQRGQKITNLLKAVENVSDGTEIFVFLDADIRIHKNFLKYLVAPLNKKTVGATSGLPWYLPQNGKLGSVLRSLWGEGALLLMIDPRHNFADGAANAIKKDVFEKANIKKAMAGSVSDTFSKTNSVKKLGLTIEFVPQCLVISPDDSSFLDTLKWTNRQTIISRVYCPPFWWTVFLSYSFGNLMLLLGSVICLLGILGKGILLLPGLLMLSLIPLEIINVAFLLPVVKQMIPQYSQNIEKLKWKYYFMAPVASILIMTNSIVSLFTNKINWRGVTYRLVSPVKTLVLETKDEYSGLPADIPKTILEKELISNVR